MISFLTTLLSYIMIPCYTLTGNWWLAIFFFTLITKIILFPVSLWCQKNSIKLVELMPDINRIKIKFFGDKETIGEEQYILFKRKNYHPLLTLIPLIIQIVILIGLIGVIYNIAEANPGSIIGLIPIESGGLTLIIPLLAGVSAFLLGLVQNRINPLQKEQSRSEQMMTNGLSIGISLVVGTFVSLGVGFYWICSNLFSILVQIGCNMVMDPKKYVDYEALEMTRTELERLKKIGDSEKRYYKKDPNKKREKVDYKNFFSVANKHLVFYSESSGFYKYFQSVIEELLSRSNIIIHYITSDPDDQVFNIAKKQQRIRPYYIGERRLITLMMKMDADMVVMTMPDLDNYHIKRSYVKKDVEYVYIFHGLFGMRTLRKGSIDHFDTILCDRPERKDEIRAIEEKYGLKSKNIIPCGYGVVDIMAKEYEKLPNQVHLPKKILIAPSWQEDNILECCIEDLVRELINAGYDLTIRPHPQYLKRNPQKFEIITEKCSTLFSTERLHFETDFSSNETVFTADLLITDWSGIGLEYAIATKKPVFHINTPMKVVNKDLEAINEELNLQFDVRIRDSIGISLDVSDIKEKAALITEELLINTDYYANEIEKIRKEELYNFGESGKYGAQYIISSLMKKQSK